MTWRRTGTRASSSSHRWTSTSSSTWASGGRSPTVLPVWPQAAPRSGEQAELGGVLRPLGEPVAPRVPGRDPGGVADAAVPPGDPGPPTRVGTRVALTGEERTGCEQPVERGQLGVEMIARARLLTAGAVV